MIEQLLFALLLATGIGMFARRVGFIRRNIAMGRDVDRSDQPSERWKVMARVALGQGKMIARPVAGVMHILIYVGFVVINLEMLEIVLDGLLGTHRLFAGLGGVYDALIACFEWLAAGVILACVVFFVRRNGMAIARFRSKEMAGGQASTPTSFWWRGVVDVRLPEHECRRQHRPSPRPRPLRACRILPNQPMVGPLYAGMGDAGVVAVERGMWWFHIAGVMAFLVYVTHSKPSTSCSPSPTRTTAI